MEAYPLSDGAFFVVNPDPVESDTKTMAENAAYSTTLDAALEDFSTYLQKDLERRFQSVSTTPQMTMLQRYNLLTPQRLPLKS